MIIKDIAQRRMECPAGCGPAACMQKRTTMFRDICDGAAECVLVIYSVHTCMECGRSTTQRIPYAADGSNSNAYTSRVKSVFLALLNQGKSRVDALKHMELVYGLAPTDTVSWLSLIHI